jgi:hypothetical protein
MSASKRSQDGTAEQFHPDFAWKTHDDGQRRCPKHVEFYDNKFG